MSKNVKGLAEFFDHIERIYKICDGEWNSKWHACSNTDRHAKQHAQDEEYEHGRDDDDCFVQCSKEWNLKAVLRWGAINDILIKIERHETS
jgi:hypothetical protein